MSQQSSDYPCVYLLAQYIVVHRHLSKAPWFIDVAVRYNMSYELCKKEKLVYKLIKIFISLLIPDIKTK